LAVIVVPNMAARRLWRSLGKSSAGSLRILLVALGILCLIVIFIVAAMSFIIPRFNARLTNYIESDAFRAEMEKETAKGLHFPSGHYEPIKRTATWTAETAGFQAKDGWKALRAVDARGITAKFNPWGVFNRLWYLEDVHIGGGEVEIQVYEPKPEPSPPKPWYGKYLLPQRVYLNHVESEPVDVTWYFRGKRAGIFGTRLLITPHDRDFEYQAHEGWLRTKPFPEMHVKHIHMLITKQLLTLYHMDLDPKSMVPGGIHAEGNAHTGPKDRSVDFRFSLERVPIEDWVPDDWRIHVGGLATSKIHWTGKDTKLENSAGEAEWRIDDGRIQGLPVLQKIAALVNDKSLERIKLDACQFDVEWHYPSIELSGLAIEEKGKFRAEGEVIVRRESLGGTVDLGIAPALLEFLTAPVVKEVFPREKNGYLWTTVHLSGTIEEPQLDLSPRIMEAISEHPTAMLKLFFRQIGASLRHAFGRE
jgi:hypothetical protein